MVKGSYAAELCRSFLLVSVFCLMLSYTFLRGCVILFESMRSGEGGDRCSASLWQPTCFWLASVLAE